MSAEPRAHKVVVIGAGYAGATAANRLRKRDDVDVTLVNPRQTFVDRIRLHQLTAGTGEALVSYDTLLGQDVELVVDSVTRIDVADRTVRLASGRSLDYDYVIYAVGSTGAMPSVPGAVDLAHSVAELDSALRLRARLAELRPDAPVTVVGGGLTGVETAAELAGRRRNITLVCGGALAPSLGAPARRAMATWFARQGVTVIDADTVTEVRADTVVLAEGGVRESAVTIWTTGFGVPELAAVSGLRTDGLGRLLTDETLTSVDDDRIVAAGDAAAPSGQPLRMSCQAASPLGAQAAETVLSRITGTEPARIDLGFVGSCISLGRGAGLRQFARKDDTAMNAYFAGRLGAAYKELSSRIALFKIRREARKPGSVPWIKGGRRPQQPVSRAGDPG